MQFTGIDDHVASSARALPRRGPLARAAGALLGAQLVHFVAAQAGTTPVAHHAAPGRVLHVIGIVGALALLVSIRRLRPRAAVYTAVAGALTAAGATVLHVVPVDSAFTSPYWGEVSIWQWLPVAAIVLAGSAAAMEGLRHRPPG